MRRPWPTGRGELLRQKLTNNSRYRIKNLKVIGIFPSPSHFIFTYTRFSHPEDGRNSLASKAGMILHYTLWTPPPQKKDYNLRKNSCENLTTLWLSLCSTNQNSISLMRDLKLRPRRRWKLRSSGLFYAARSGNYRSFGRKICRSSVIA
jgi:hypothetical protein